MTYCVLKTNLLLRSSPPSTRAGNGKEERQQLDGGMDSTKHSFKT